jgi:8-amino-7-oxononanoate synthase
MSWRSTIQQRQQERRDSGNWRQRQVVESSQGARVTIDGKTYDNFCSNDYLGLANDPRLVEAAAEALQTFGVGSGASHLVCGHQTPHHELEEKLAHFVGAEKAIVFSTGYMANLAIAQALLSRGDCIFQDKLNHASLIDAGRHCDAQFKRYAHCDTNALAKLLTTHADCQKMVMTDGVFSMDGNVAPLPEIADLCEKSGTLLVVDEAHGFGVLGNGRGAAAQAGIFPSENVLIMGTLGKAIGSFGAFVAGEALFIEQLIQFGRTYIYTTALPPHVVATTLASIDVSEREPKRRTLLANNIVLFQKQMEAKTKTPSNNKSKTAPDKTAHRLLLSSTPIQPLLIGDAETAMAASRFLKQNGILVSAIRPPTVPVNSSRLRITLNASHHHDAIDRLTEVLCSQAFQEILASNHIAIEEPK